MTCYRAKREMRRYKKPIRYRFTTPGGFHCKRVSGMRLSGTWRCGRNGKAFRFRFAD